MEKKSWIANYKSCIISTIWKGPWMKPWGTPLPIEHNIGYIATSKKKIIRYFDIMFSFVDEVFFYFGNFSHNKKRHFGQVFKKNRDINIIKD